MKSEGRLFETRRSAALLGMRRCASFIMWLGRLAVCNSQWRSMDVPVARVGRAGSYVCFSRMKVSVSGNMEAGRLPSSTPTMTCRYLSVFSSSSTSTW
jgi:hypothetical protein